MRSRNSGGEITSTRSPSPRDLDERARGAREIVTSTHSSLVYGRTFLERLLDEGLEDELHGDLAARPHQGPQG
jgi:hypothetical protein